MEAAVKVGDAVRDRWWPHRRGRVRKVLKTRLHVESDGEIWNYDLPHRKFLEVVPCRD
jgi:hypothetical protein